MLFVGDDGKQSKSSSNVSYYMRRPLLSSNPTQLLLIILLLTSIRGQFSVLFAEMREHELLEPVYYPWNIQEESRPLADDSLCHAPFVDAGLRKVLAGAAAANENVRIFIAAVILHDSLYLERSEGLDLAVQLEPVPMVFLSSCPEDRSSIFVILVAQHSPHVKASLHL